MTSHLRASVVASCFIAAALMLPKPLATALEAGQAAAVQEQGAAGAEESPNLLFVTVGNVVTVTSVPVIQRVAVGFGDVAEATAVGPREVLVSGKAVGSTSLIVWQEGGGKLYFNVTVRPNTTATSIKLEGLRRELRQELPGQQVSATVENETVFLRGTVKDLTSADRAVAIAGTMGKVVNLLYVSVPEAESQILLKVRFASVDRTVSSELGLNLISTGATNTVGTVTTQQFSPPKLEHQADGTNTLTLTDALNIFLLRPDLNLGATIRAMQRKALIEILAEPNVLAINGKPASFLAGGEYPYPILQGGGSGLGTVTIQFREFGVRISFLPTITPRGTIRLEVAPEVSALDFANGLVFQGFSIPALTVRRVHTEIELTDGQSFAIGGLLDRRLTETLMKIPLLADIPVLGKIFQSRSLQRQNSELLVIVTPELVRPIPVGQPLPQVQLPKELSGPDVLPRTPGIAVTGGAGGEKPPTSIPVEQLIQSLKQAETGLAGGAATSGLANSSWRPQTDLPQSLQPAASPSRAPESPAMTPARQP